MALRRRHETRPATEKRGGCLSWFISGRAPTGLRISQAWSDSLQTRRVCAWSPHRSLSWSMRRPSRVIGAYTPEPKSKYSCKMKQSLSEGTAEKQGFRQAYSRRIQQGSPEFMNTVAPISCGHYSVDSEMPKFDWDERLNSFVMAISFWQSLNKIPADTQQTHMGAFILSDRGTYLYVVWCMFETLAGRDNTGRTQAHSFFDVVFSSLAPSEL